MFCEPSALGFLDCAATLVTQEGVRKRITPAPSGKASETVSHWILIKHRWNLTRRLVVFACSLTRKTTLVCWYKALATLIRCFWPPDRMMPCTRIHHKEELIKFRNICLSSIVEQRRSEFISCVSGGWRNPTRQRSSWAGRAQFPAHANKSSPHSNDDKWFHSEPLWEMQPDIRNKEGDAHKCYCDTDPFPDLCLVPLWKNVNVGL